MNYGVDIIEENAVRVRAGRGCETKKKDLK